MAVEQQSQSQFQHKPSPLHSRYPLAFQVRQEFGRRRPQIDQFRRSNRPSPIQQSTDRGGRAGAGRGGAESVRRRPSHRRRRHAPRILLPQMPALQFLAPLRHRNRESQLRLAQHRHGRCRERYLVAGASSLRHKVRPVLRLSR